MACWPIEVFRAATINNVRRFGLEKDYGTVSAGKVANLLLLDGNPLESMRAWSRIDKIVLRGKVIERETLAADASFDELRTSGFSLRSY